MKVLAILAALSIWFFSQPALAQNVWVIEISGGIGPATSDYVSREIVQAHKEQASFIVLKVDTPGGLDTSMRDIIRAITTSPLPVATWVGPAGSRAASAGTYILLASHVAAMAPGTNLGAATPVSLTAPVGKDDDSGGNPFAPKKEKEPDAPDDDADQAKEEDAADSDKVTAKTAMEKKVINDARAYIRGLAKLHGRNEEWAETAVTEAASIDAEKALELNVIDFLASDLDSLVTQSNGRTVIINGLEAKIELADVAYIEREQDWRFKLLSVITNPNVAYILMLIGIYGLLLEFYNPGVGLPGVLGGICLLLAMYSLQMLPVSYAGLALLLLGIALMVAEAFSPSFGILGLGGIVAFALGSVMLMDTETPGYQIAIPLIAGLTVVSALFTFVILSLLLKTRRKPVTTGVEVLLGQEAIVVGGFPGSGRVLVDGEIWQANCDAALVKGDKVTVVQIHGLCLEVEVNQQAK
ncbi:NfeD family protein [Photobacterium sp. DNB23_23_1]|uniref:Nodulation protein NfeD n=1 Tax=Photobacterium pectinilyticum TaxID=2906793 RepID=A0ABT1MWW3_9GAMM|nr:nodulation protein NfeD [Photobacterium sp. ZSDE20]MCQ1056968.1 nodulation protein NfeD [Photobacterium sp. ZSDE20]MDD1821103.1 nodulation protein NfeD [Photobacterium sp. ZSDE20]